MGSMAPGLSTSVGGNTYSTDYIEEMGDSYTSSTSSTEREKTVYEMFVDTYMANKGNYTKTKKKRKKRIKPASYRKKK